MNDLPIATQESRKVLNERQLDEYQMHRMGLAEWLLEEGKDPKWAEGYSKDTTKDTLYRLDQFNRWVWQQKNRVTFQFTHSHADAYIRDRVQNGDYSNSDHASVAKALKRYFKWKFHQYNGETWECDYNFNTNKRRNQPYFTSEQRNALREAVLTFKSVPEYESVDEEKRDEIKAHLAQRFQKPKEEITKKDWERANSWKIPSLVSVSLDIGLRPVEVEEARTSWFNEERGSIEIPVDQSAKNEDYWECALREDTVRRLEKWLDEREQWDEYTDTDRIWLTLDENPYQSHTLKTLLRDLCDEAGIAENREVSWYMIRRSVATYMGDNTNLATVADQMRHKDIRSTREYMMSPVDKRRKNLNEMDDPDS